MRTFLAALCLSLCIASVAAAAEDIVIGVTPFPHSNIMKVAKPLLEREGYNLVIREFTDYVQPNTALAEKQLFANFFQHIPYFDNMNKEQNLGLAWIAKVHIEPMGLYSRRVTSLDEIRPGSRIAVPNDPTNEARALRLLEKHGLITLKPGELVTARDVVDNPKKLEISELDAAQLPRTLDDVAAAVINTNFAGEAGLNPSRDAIIIEDKDSPYANIVVVREEDRNSAAAKALVKAVQSDEVRTYINDVLVPRGIVPAF